MLDLLAQPLFFVDVPPPFMLDLLPGAVLIELAGAAMLDLLPGTPILTVARLCIPARGRQFVFLPPPSPSAPAANSFRAALAFMPSTPPASDTMPSTCDLSSFICFGLSSLLPANLSMDGATGTF
jgi:hypothetical protein